MHFVQIMLPVAALALCASASTSAVVTGYVGSSHKLSFAARDIPSTATFEIKGQADYLAITEVYPDQPASCEYHYSVGAEGIDTYERRHQGIGFGP